MVMRLEVIPSTSPRDAKASLECIPSLDERNNIKPTATTNQNDKAMISFQLLNQ